MTSLGKHTIQSAHPTFFRAHLKAIPVEEKRLEVSVLLRQCCVHHSVFPIHFETMAKLVGLEPTPHGKEPCDLPTKLQPQIKSIRSFLSALSIYF